MKNSMKRGFYNTNIETGAELAKSWETARDQQSKILGFFAAHPGRDFTPFEVQAHTEIKIITSVRRAITNLTLMGFLRKTPIQKLGNHGKMNFCWTYAYTPNGKQLQADLAL